MDGAKEGLETVKVGITNTPTGIVVDREPFRVSKAKDTSRLQVEWICHTSGFTVKFKDDESPFERSEFSRTDPGAVLSGTVREGVSADGPDGPHRKNYEYTVTIGQRSIDPTGQVDP